jgi:hypothetical protein
MKAEMKRKLGVAAKKSWRIVGGDIENETKYKAENNGEKLPSENESCQWRNGVMSSMSKA